MEDKGNGSNSENVTLSTCGFLACMYYNNKEVI